MKSQEEVIKRIRDIQSELIELQIRGLTARKYYFMRQLNKELKVLQWVIK